MTSLYFYVYLPTILHACTPHVLDWIYTLIPLAAMVGMAAIIAKERRAEGLQ
jgi:hypothetical protein